jgi:hypothetical protein
VGFTARIELGGADFVSRRKRKQEQAVAELHMSSFFTKL